jgi:catechol 2,3-dioxygenase-like lactoylglutathione lyase family enzyme
MKPAGTVTTFEPLGLDHVVLRVRDQAVAQRFYIDVLGASLDHVNDRVQLIQLRFGSSLIDLLPATSVLPVPEGAGLDHFCLSIRCEDLARVREALLTRGVTVDGDVVDRRGAFGSGPSLYLRDPDGYRIELKPRT